jgi:hypothetical protein
MTTRACLSPAGTLNSRLTMTSERMLSKLEVRLSSSSSVEYYSIVSSDLIGKCSSIMSRFYDEKVGGKCRYGTNRIRIRDRHDDDLNVTHIT